MFGWGKTIIETKTEEIDWSIAIPQEQVQVKIKFPKNAKDLSVVLDWMYNSGDFATCYLNEKTIEKARKAGLVIEKVEEKKDD